MLLLLTAGLGDFLEFEVLAFFNCLALVVPKKLHLTQYERIEMWTNTDCIKSTEMMNVMPTGLTATALKGIINKTTTYNKFNNKFYLYQTNVG